MAPIDRNTRRLIERLKTRIMVLTSLVVVFAILFVIMTVLYICKDGNPAKDDSANVSSAKNISADAEAVTNASTESGSGSVQNTTSDTQSKSEEKPVSSTSSVTSTTSNTSSQNKGTSSTSSKVSSESTTTAANATALGDTANSWNLKLVNGKNSLPKGYSVKTSAIKSEFDAYGYLTYDSRAISYLHSMCAAAKKDGVKLYVVSGFRTNSKQQSLFNNQVNKQRAKYPNLSEDELIKKASTISAYPGTSEHELGLAVDFNSVEEAFETTAAFQWLKAHAAEYGFIMRYAKDKQSITGVIYEPWHYRFVGEKHAKKINELGFCLEEYIDYLNKQGK